MDEELRTYLDGKFGDAGLRLAERLQDMKTDMDTKFVDVEARLSEKMRDMQTDMDTKFVDTEARLTEKMRDMQTELLRGFESFSTGQGIRLRKLEADQSNLDVSLRGRVDVLESRLMQIELRLKIN